MSASVIAILGGIVMAGFGLLHLVAPDLMWTMQRWDNSWEGRRSERSGLWEIRRVFGGLVLLVGGLVFAFIGFSMI